MRRWFLSYNSQDLPLVRAFEAALRNLDADAHIFFAPRSLRAGGYWLPELAKEIAEATAFVLLVGEKGVGAWQVPEYYEAIDRRVKEPGFPIVLVLLNGQPAPGLPFLRQLHWIVTPEPAAAASLGKLLDAAAGDGTRPGELWRYVAPYRGLAAMEEKDSDYFFGREHETIEILAALAGTPEKLSILLGNSGVGKSSLAQAGVLAALKRQGWPDGATDAGEWPHAFSESRRWCFLSMRPGAEPLRALVEVFLETWQLDRTSTEWPIRRAEWCEALLNGRLTLGDLIDQTARRHAELQHPEPLAFLLYIDQGEELYVRADIQQRARFSALLAEALEKRRLHAMMSLRADFFGELQADEPLYRVHRQISVPPLRESQIRAVVSRPAELLAARFETERIAETIARRTAEDSTQDAGALPLLSYLLDDMWTQMVERGDGILRLPEQAFELGGVLVGRAESFIASHPDSVEKLRSIFTLKLATVREDGEPTRRSARRSEFSDEEWRLVSDLADHPYRLLITATLNDGSDDAGSSGAATSSPSETHAEVAHEAIFRRWTRLREWIAGEREFLAWRSQLETARRAWAATPEQLRPGALLMGLSLFQAQKWLAKRADDIAPADRDFIIVSHKTADRQRLRVRMALGALAAVILVGLVGWMNERAIRETWRWMMVVRPYMVSDVRPHVLTAEAEHALKPGDSFRECAGACPEMVVVPPGSFVMGSPADESGHSANESPQHQVTFARPLAVSRFEVTFADWDACATYGDCRATVRENGWGREKQPVIDVTWDDAKRYVAWLSRMTGRNYRLLSETEWEYAARAGSETAYSWGNDVGQARANCNGCGSQWDAVKPAPVGSFAPNAFGLYDMHGNVWEWVEDCYHATYDGAPNDGTAWRDGGECDRPVIRGGSFNAAPRNIRSGLRGRGPTGGKANDIGFRVARTIAAAADPSHGR